MSAGNGPELTSVASNVTFHVTETGENATLYIDEVEVSHKVKAVSIHTSVDHISTMIVEYACVEGIVDGELVIVHKCPHWGDKDEEE